MLRGPTNQGHLRSQCYELFGFQTGAGLAAGSLNAAVLAWVTHPSFGNLPVYWLVVTLGLNTVRYGLVSRWALQTESTVQTLLFRRTILRALVLISSALWGYAVFRFFAPADSVQGFVVLFLAAGMTAGATGAYSMDPVALRLFIIPFTGVLSLRLALEGGEYYFLSAVAAYYGATLIRMGLQHHLRWEKVARLGSENEKLLEEVKQSNQKLQEINDSLIDSQLEVAQGSRTKSDFLATMTHEIRTPLNGIMGLTDLIAESGLRNDQKELVATLKTSGTFLLSLVNDILDFSKIEAGQLKLEWTPFDLRRAAEDVYRLLLPQATSKGLHLQCEVDQEVPQVVVGDLNRIQQILINLMGNAVKFTAKGAVSVRLRLADAVSTHVPLIIEVSDTGIGIPDDQIQNLFQKFNQIDGSTARQFGGTGLGLAICRSLIERMEGKISVKSVVGNGSTFTASCQLKVAGSDDQPVNAAPRTSEAEYSLDSGLRVLVVDDNAVNRLVLVRFLKNMKVEADVGVDGIEAVSKAKRNSYDIIFMDLAMPGMDGFEATRQIRAAHTMTQPVIVAVTASAIKAELDKCTASGMDGYLTKPIRSQDIFQALSKIKKTSESETTIDAQTTKSLLEVGDAQFYSELVKEFENVCHECEIKFKDALASQDKVMLSKIAHKLKGAAVNLGAKALAGLCLRLELDVAGMNESDIQNLVQEIARASEDAIHALDQSQSSKAA